jgi:pimeloyl-ACP methyl ester carboxylesterase
MATPRDGFTRLGKLRFHFLDWGADGNPPLLLVHGAAQTAHSWDEVAPDLSQDHHVLAIDQRGHGDTDWAPSYRREDFVGDISAFLDDRGWAAATLVALSLGGLNAIAFAAAHPARARGLIVVDVAPTIQRPAVDAVRSQLSLRDFASFEEALERAHAFNPRRTIENIRDRLRHALKPSDGGRWTYKFDPGIAEGEATADLEALWDRARQVKCPTLLVRGGESAMVATDVADRFARDVGAETAVVSGAGHSVMGDNPEGFLSAVRPFLARHRL